MGGRLRGVLHSRSNGENVGALRGTGCSIGEEHRDTVRRPNQDVAGVIHAGRPQPEVVGSRHPAGFAGY